MKGQEGDMYGVARIQRTSAADSYHNRPMPIHVYNDYARDMPGFELAHTHGGISGSDK